MSIRFSHYARLFVLAAAIITLLAAPPAQAVQMQPITIFPALGSTSMKTPLVVGVPVPGANGGKPVQFNVTNITAVQIPAGATQMQVETAYTAASAAKAKAIVDEFNNNAANFPGVTISTKMVMAPVVVGSKQVIQNVKPIIGYKKGQPVYGPNQQIITNQPVYANIPLTQVIFTGTTMGKSVIFGTKDIPDPTKEAGNGKPALQNGGNPPPTTTPPSTGTMFNPTTSTGFNGTSSGVDPLGNQSVVAIGFYDDTTPDPLYYIAGLDPTPGEPLQVVFEQLDEIFNADFNSMGVSATLDNVNGELSVDVPANDTFYYDDSDTGLTLTGEITPLPSAATGGMVLIGGLMVGRFLTARKARKV